MDFFKAEFFLNDVRYQFQFNRMFSPGGWQYFVEALGDKGGKYSFMMQQRNGEWRIVNAPKLPDKILETEKKLSMHIKRKFSGN